MKMLIIFVLLSAVLLISYSYYNREVGKDDKGSNLERVVIHSSAPIDHSSSDSVSVDQNRISLEAYFSLNRGKQVSILGYLSTVKEKPILTVVEANKTDSLFEFELQMEDGAVPAEGNYAVRGILSQDGKVISNVQLRKVRDGIYPLSEWVLGLVPLNPHEYREVYEVIADSLIKRGKNIGDYYVLDINSSDDGSQNITLFNRNNFFGDSEQLGSQYQDYIVTVALGITMEEGVYVVKEVKEVNLALPN